MHIHIIYMLILFDYSNPITLPIASHHRNRAQERLLLALGHPGCAHSGRALGDGGGSAELRLYLSSTEHAMLGEAGGGLVFFLAVKNQMRTMVLAYLPTKLGHFSDECR